MTDSPTDVVAAWLAAVNAGDADAVLACTAPDVAIIGPRGTARGHEVLRSWLGHAGASFDTVATYAADDAVVVAQRGVWRDPESGAVRGTAEVATRFRVAEACVAEIQRYDDLPAALRDARLSIGDDQSDGPPAA